MSRAIWKGTISFGLVSIPVALHTVEKPSHARVSLHMYDKRDMAPVGNKLVNKETGEEITRDDVVKGFEAEGRVVVLTEEDLDSAKAEKNQQVEIAAFVDKDEIPVGYFDRPYYIEPQKSGRKGYALLRAALSKSGKAGIAKVVISTKQYLAAVYPEGDVLILELLRWGHEVKDASEIDVPPKDLHASKVTDKELDLAVRLVDEMSVARDVAALPTHDEHDQILRATVRDPSRRRRGDVEEPTGADLPHLVGDLDLCRAGVHEVELVLRVVVVEEALVARRHHDHVDAEGLDPQRLPHLAEPVAGAELLDRAECVAHRSPSSDPTSASIVRSRPSSKPIRGAKPIVSRAASISAQEAWTSPGRAGS